MLKYEPRNIIKLSIDWLQKTTKIENDNCLVEDIQEEEDYA